MGQFHILGITVITEKRNLLNQVVIQDTKETKARKFKGTAQSRYSNDKAIRHLGLNCSHMSPFENSLSRFLVIHFYELPINTAVTVTRTSSHS